MIYLDNASTSYPKPPEISELLAHFYDMPVGSYGRTLDERTLSLSLRVEQLRDRLCEQISGVDGSHVAFCYNATMALNMVIGGIPSLRREDVLITPLEHNAVTRPLHALSGEGYAIMPGDHTGRVDVDALREQLERSPHYRLVIINGMSNVNGVIQPIREICATVRSIIPSCLIAVDAAQCLPAVCLKCQEWGISFVAMAGHKGWLAPTGIAALYVADPNSLPPLLRGGNGVRSESQESSLSLPDRYEVGTLNLPGAVAWEVALRNYPTWRVSSTDLSELLVQIADRGYRVYSATDKSCQGPLFSISSPRYSADELGNLLWERAQIIVRTGLHCAPLAHATLGTAPIGTCRISLSPYTTHEELNTLLQVLDDL